MIKSLLLGCVGFVLVAFGQPGWSVTVAPLAALVGYALFWRAATAFPSRKRRFWVAACFFAFAQLIQFSWMTSYRFQGLYILGVYAFLAICFGLQFGCLSLLIPREGRLTLFRMLLIASVWTILEWSRYFPLCGITFNPVGLALTSTLASLQFAAIWGVLGLSFWVILTNTCAFNLMRHGFRLSSFTLFLGVALVPYLFGEGHLMWHRSARDKAEHLEVALVQTGLLPSQKVPLKGHFDAFIAPLEQWSLITKALVERIQKVDLIVLPEAALPLLFDQTVYPYEGAVHMLQAHLGSGIFDVFPELELPFAKHIDNVGSQEVYVSNAFFAQTLANFFDAEVVIGLDGRDHREGKYFSSAYYFRPHGREICRYEKRVLLPLAEHLPFEWCRNLAKRYGIHEFFEPGREAKVFKGKVPFSVSICYEETFASLIRQGRQRGAEVLVNVTNDNWYPESRLPKQHFDLARLRTLENGAPLLRACNSGITAAVDSLGTISSKLGSTHDQSEWQPGLLLASVSTYHYIPLFLFWGNAGILTICFIMVAIALLGGSRIFALALNESGKLPFSLL